MLFLVVVEDLTRGTGRYSLAIGLTSAAWGLGAALSNTVAGFIVQAAGSGGASWSWRPARRRVPAVPGRGAGDKPDEAGPEEAGPEDAGPEEAVAVRAA